MKKKKVLRNGQKTLRGKEKLLIMSNFSFSLSVLKRLVLQTCKNQGLFGKGLNKEFQYLIVTLYFGVCKCFEFRRVKHFLMRFKYYTGVKRHKKVFNQQGFHCFFR